MPHPTSWRVSRKLLGWMLLLSIVPLLLTNTVGYQRTQEIIVRLVASYLGAVAQEQAQHARDHIDRQEGWMRAAVAENDILQRGAQTTFGESRSATERATSTSRVERELQRRLADTRTLSALYLVSSGGLLIASAGRADVLVTTGLPTNSLQPLVEVIPADGQRAEPMVRFLAPVVSDSGRTIAWLAGIATHFAFRELLELPAGLMGDVESYVIDDAGRLLMNSRVTTSVNYAKPLPLPQGVSRESTELYGNRNGRQVFGTSAEIPGYRWRVVVEAPAAVALDELRALGQFALGLGTFLVISVIAAAWMVTSGMVRPLRRLVSAAERVATGDLSSRVPVESDDEIGELAVAFNRMTSGLRDANERVRILHEREIERASRLATVGELASGVAHEIKNPLVGIASGLELIRRHVTNVAELDPIMDEMSKQLTRMQLTLRDLLAYARPATPALSPVTASAVIARALRLVQPAATRQGVSVMVDADEQAPPFLADEELLREALVNLLMNAVQATPMEGRITVRAITDGSWIEIAVEDSGHGIAASEMDSVFKPFFTTRHAGTGLGLPISREIAERHGGTLKLASTVGVGTTVTIRIPARRDDALSGEGV